MPTDKDKRLYNIHACQQSHLTFYSAKRKVDICDKHASLK